jgi:microcin C transport system permease protein
MFRHVLPNALVATITFMPFTLAGSVTLLTSLDFLGIGLPPGSASLGEVLAQGKANLQAPWLGLTAFFTIAIMLSLLCWPKARPTCRRRGSASPPSSPSPSC